MAHLCGSQSARGRDHQPRGQCARCHAARWQADHRDRQRLFGRSICVGSGGGDARPVRHDCGQRYRHRHDARRAGEGIRALLHHQRGGARNGSGSFAGLWFREAVGRSCEALQRGRAGHDREGLLATAAFRRGSGPKGSRCSVVGGAKSEVILVVEDDADVRAYSSDTLRELGYTVIEAENGSAALQALQERPDIVLLFTDIGLPGGMNGRKLSEEALQRRSDLKVLFTSGYARSAIVHDGHLDPGVELITKPFTQAALAARLRDLLDARARPSRVLVVEDEVLLQMLAIDSLEDVGLTVETTGSAAEAMNKVRLVPGGVDAAVIDIGLPDRRGDLLVRELRAIYPALPILIVSGRGDTELRAMFKGDTKISVVGKPFMPADLVDALRALGILVCPRIDTDAGSRTRKHSHPRSLRPACCEISRGRRRGLSIPATRRARHPCATTCVRSCKSDSARR